jgi:phosphoribosylformimino-5-aminoimidazole carboxamide ribotide isomerase
VKLVPVIDLAGGTVVRAVRGERERYRPIVSRLSAGHDPADIAIALANYCAADTLYIADLDAIRGGAVQQAALARIAGALPGCALWLDAGFRRVRDAAPVCTGRIEPVFGSESLADGDELALLRGRADLLLSLD